MFKIAEEGQRIFEKRFSDETPKFPLFHYTDLNALCSILSNKSLRFTYIKHSNDGQEFIHGMTLFKEIYISRRNEFPNLADEFVDFLDREKDPTYKPYILCLSELGDSLGQWRGYANFGKGVSIELRESLLNQTGRHILRKVIYDDAQKTQACHQLLDDLKTIFNQTTQNNFEDLFPMAVGLILTLSSTFKAEAFAEEKEWRWIYFPEPTEFKPNIRCKNNERLILYCDQDFDLNNIVSIALGPDVNKREVSLDTLNELIFSYKYSYVIKNSSLSFYS